MSRLALLALALAPLAQAAERPNVVYFLADDLGWNDVGWHGKELKTPNLDKLAHAGARLEQFYVQPLCSPTRAAFLTGRYPMRHGLQVGVVRPWAGYGLPLEERTLPQALKEVGYTTAIVGKWHLGHSRRDYLPTRRGFDHQYGHYNGALDYFTHVRDGGFDWHKDDRVNRDEGYSTHLLAKEACRLVSEHDKAKPLLLYVPFNAVHAPHQVPEKYKAPYAKLPEPRRTYAGMLAAMDEAVGQIVAAIDARGMRSATLFFFSSDNGGPQPGKVTDNGHLRAQKSTVYEGGVRVPAFAAWQGKVKPDTVVEQPLHVVDLYPTILKLAGAELVQMLPIDGLDAWPAIAEGKAMADREILINAAPNAGALRVGDWKLVLHGLRGKERVELFHLRDDPGERKNLADAEPGRVNRMRARYDALARQAVRPKARGEDGKPPDYKAPKVWGEG
ncbi:MAG: arylsulfatase [Gemmataceae bacterium]